MNRRVAAPAATSGRVQWGSYGFMAGLVVGVLLGWMLSGFIGAFVRVGIVALIVVPLVLLFLAWRRYVTPLLRPPVEREVIAAPNVIDAQVIAPRQVREPQPR